MESKPQGKTYIPGLDGIRGLAVLTVFLFHAELLPHIPGELATTTFFFLSGFLITTLFLKEWFKNGTLSLGAFYSRRALRILPPLYVVLGIAVAARVFGHVGEHVIAWKAMGNFFQYTNYAITGSDDGAGFLPGMILLWSLAVDEHFYLFYAPLLKAALQRISIARFAQVLVGICVVIFLWRCYLVHSLGATYRVSMATDTRVDSIFWGAILALWRNPALTPQRAAWLAKPLPVILGCIGVVLPSLTGSDALKCTVGYTLEGIALMPLFSLAILQGGKGALRFLQWPWLLWISRISYPLYLVSWLMLSTVRQFVHGPRVLQVAVAFAATIIFASLMHIYLERPILTLRKRARTPKRVTSGRLDAAVPSTN